MQRPTILTILILLVAILSFAALASPTVPVSTTQMMTQVSYSPYLMTDTVTYTSTTFTTISYSSLQEIIGNVNGPPYESAVFVAVTTVTYSLVRSSLLSTYELQGTSTVPEMQTLTSSSFVPESEVLGLTDGSFTALAIVVIGSLIVVAMWFELKRIHHQKPKQATLTQFVKSSTSCVKCGAELPPASEFCNKCGSSVQ